MKFRFDKKMIGIGVVAVLWLSLSIGAWVKPATEYSEAERRTLATFPAFDKDFPKKFEDYALDQFPFRDAFRTVKSVSEYYAFGRLDNNGIYLSKGYASKLLYPMSERDVNNACFKMTQINKSYLKDCNVYVSVVPDKSYFLAKESGRLSIDYREMVEKVQKGTPFAKYIDIFPALSLEDYYKTDTHWKCENLEEVSALLRKGMNAPASIATYEVKQVEKPFYGVYYGQSALPLPAETISYITNDTLQNATMYNAQTQKTTSIYTPEAASKDGYNFFLGGSVPLVTVNNPKGEEGRELILFRDSFGSSLAPWLIEGYSKVTLADVRYIASNVLGNYIDFHGQDVLFLYSTLVLNENLATFK
ncbi:MAG: hypothetical protein J6D37_05680 [Clostridia bacterium]|nr:hypothetical protein [Clostridia bacterium]